MCREIQIALGMPGRPGGLLYPHTHRRAGGTTIVAIVAGGLVSPTGRPLGLHEVSALAVGGTAKIRTGDTVLMLKVVGVVKASVRRDGRIQAQGSSADYARLGVVEDRLDRAAGPG
jgi:hypothetical protein